MKYITLEDSVMDLPLSQRTRNCLCRMEIQSVGDMLRYEEENGDWLSVKNLGAKSQAELQEMIRTLESEEGEYRLVGVERTEAPAEECKTQTVELPVSTAAGLPLEKLNLSVRAMNCLHRANIHTADQLEGMTLETLLAMRNMGRKTAEEVMVAAASISELLAVPEKRIDPSVLDVEMEAKRVAEAQLRDVLIQEAMDIYGGARSTYLLAYKEVRKRYPEAQGETLVYRFYEQSAVRNLAKVFLLYRLEKAEEGLAWKRLEEEMPAHLRNTTLPEELLLELEREGGVSMGEVMVQRQYPSIQDFLRELPEGRNTDVLKARFTGRTLEEVGSEYDLTRERVRQITEKLLRKRPRLREDRYRAVFDRYDFSRQTFRLAFEEPEITYTYLDLTSTTKPKDRLPLDETLLADEGIPAGFRRKAERTVYRNYILLDGGYVKKSRPELTRHMIKTRCRAQIRVDDFMALYHAELERLGLAEDPSLTLETRTYENKLNQSRQVLWSQWRSFRYYPIDEQDYSDLLQGLGLESYMDMEISALKLFREHPELMEEYDIRDEYELHNLLKKVWPEDGVPIDFKRMPTLGIGKTDRNDQILTLLLRYAPISGEDFAKKYEEAYGIKASTVMGSYMAGFAEYYYHGMYTITAENLPLNQAERMRRVLSEDFYSVEEARRLYLREFQDGDAKQINPYTLSTLGFRVYENYVVRNTYSNAASYFRAILTGEDLVDATAFDPAILRTNSYGSILQSLRSTYEIVEYQPLHYINLHRLEAGGVGRERLQDYCGEVAKRYEPGQFFTLGSLRANGFSHPLDDLGFDDWFYSSLLAEDREHFTYQRIGGTRLFRRGTERAMMGDMLTWLLNREQKMDLYDLIDLLKDHFGIRLPKEKVMEIIRGTDLYYDTIMEAVYIDYDTYFEEI